MQTEIIAIAERDECKNLPRKEGAKMLSVTGYDKRCLNLRKKAYPCPATCTPGVSVHDYAQFRKVGSTVEWLESHILKFPCACSLPSDIRRTEVHWAKSLYPLNSWFGSSSDFGGDVRFRPSPRKLWTTTNRANLLDTPGSEFVFYKTPRPKSCNKRLID